MNETTQTCELKNIPSKRFFEYSTVAKNRLLISISITIMVMLIELIGGLIINSVALISDAGHMFTHAIAIGIGLFAILISRKPPCSHKTYGLYRAEVLGAFINGLFLIPIAGFIIFEAIMRIIFPLEIDGISMLLLAIIGLAVNILSIALLFESHKTNLNIKGVFFHMFGDAASSIGIVMVAIIILNTGWTILDPIVSIGISIIILYWSWGILRDSSRVLLEISPKGLDSQMIYNDVIKYFPKVKEIYHMHLWTITPDILVFSAYVKFNDINLETEEYLNIITKISQFLKDKYNIIESTIQFASNDEIENCNIC
ncbi:MAG: cation diffusion facilitator family transporter [Promethearchaeota archaeon]